MSRSDAEDRPDDPTSEAEQERIRSADAVPSPEPVAPSLDEPDPGVFQQSRRV